INKVVGALRMDLVVWFAISHVHGYFAGGVLRIALQPRPAHAPLLHDAADHATAVIVTDPGDEQRIVPQCLEMPGHIEWRTARYPRAILKAIEQDLTKDCHMQVMNHCLSVRDARSHAVPAQSAVPLLSLPPHNFHSCRPCPGPGTAPPGCRSHAHVPARLPAPGDWYWAPAPR